MTDSNKTKPHHPRLAELLNFFEQMQNEIGNVSSDSSSVAPRRLEREPSKPLNQLQQRHSDRTVDNGMVREVNSDEMFEFLEDLKGGCDLERCETDQDQCDDYSIYLLHARSQSQSEESEKNHSVYPKNVLETIENSPFLWPTRKPVAMEREYHQIGKTERLSLVVPVDSEDSEIEAVLEINEDIASLPTRERDEVLRKTSRDSNVRERIPGANTAKNIGFENEKKYIYFPTDSVDYDDALVRVEDVGRGALQVGKINSEAESGRQKNYPASRTVNTKNIYFVHESEDDADENNSIAEFSAPPVSNRQVSERVSGIKAAISNVSHTKQKDPGLGTIKDSRVKTERKYVRFTNDSDDREEKYGGIEDFPARDSSNHRALQVGSIAKAATTYMRYAKQHVKSDLFESSVKGSRMKAEKSKLSDLEDKISDDSHGAQERNGQLFIRRDEVTRSKLRSDGLLSRNSTASNEENCSQDYRPLLSDRSPILCNEVSSMQNNEQHSESLSPDQASQLDAKNSNILFEVSGLVEGIIADVQNAVEEPFGDSCHNSLLEPIPYLVAIDLWSDNKRIVKQAMVSLGEHCVTIEGKQEILGCGGHLAIVLAMKRWPAAPDVLVEACHILEKASRFASFFAESATRIGALEVILTCMKEYQKDEKLQASACSALCALAWSKKTAELFVFRLKGIEAFHEAMIAFPFCTLLMQNACRFFHHISAWPEFRRPAVAAGVLGALSYSIETFTADNNEDEIIQLNAREAVKRLVSG